ncbi:MAG: uroporphyrinogen decarboxylase family protein [Clostridiales Family XIII bacterium]|jgi:MtaA/CmuA family methyltransferase|nr:uroporphyrinogen decarboxylase family protein [Clostridiales Family XIII bacterium]
MKPSERLRARLAGRPVDKIPNLNIVMGLAAKEAGVSYSAYAQDYRHLCEGNVRCAEMYGIDVYCTISDPAREASALGADIAFQENGPPYVTHSPIYEAYGADRLALPDPLDSPRTLDRILGAGELARRSAGEYPVVGWVEGVLAETADMREISRLMVDLMDEPPGMRETMDAIFGFQCLFAKRQVEAGADYIGVGNAVASLIGPALYEQYALDYDRRLVAYIHGLGAGVKLHICGNITPLLPLLARVAPDILDVDHMVDFAEAVRTFQGTPTAVDGNVDPAGVMLLGSVEDVRQGVRACIAAGDETTMIAAGCEIPAATPPENLKAMDRLLYRSV